MRLGSCKCLEHRPIKERTRSRFTSPCRTSEQRLTFLWGQENTLQGHTRNSCLLCSEGLLRIMWRVHQYQSCSRDYIGILGPLRATASTPTSDQTRTNHLVLIKLCKSQVSTSSATRVGSSQGLKSKSMCAKSLEPLAIRSTTEGCGSWIVPCQEATIERMCYMRLVRIPRASTGTVQ